MYTLEDIKSDLAGGMFSGAIFSICWGYCHGIYYSYYPGIALKKYLFGIAKNTGTSLIFFTPLFALAKVTTNYCQDKGYSNLQIGCATFAVCFLGFFALSKTKMINFY